VKLVGESHQVLGERLDQSAEAVLYGLRGDPMPISQSFGPLFEQFKGRVWQGR
jgi:hypothetical protein